MTDAPNKEQLRRASLARDARQLICECFMIESGDDTSLTAYYRGFYLQLSFSELHPLIVFCLAKKIPDTESPKQLATANELNLRRILGNHTLNPEVGCYAYRAVHWLDAKLTRERLFEILERLAGEAQRGYNRLSV